VPELPETGRTITAVTIRESRLRWPVPAALTTLLPQQVIQHCERRGKYLLLHTGIGTLLLHLGMSGRLALLSPDEPLRKHDHIDIYFIHQKILRFHDPRRFGAVLWTETPATHPLLVDLGVEPLSKVFSGKYLYERTRKRQVPVKSFIMNAQQVVGVGNIYANESLFLAHIAPHRQAYQLTLLECEDLVTCIKSVLRKAITRGGSSLRDFVSADGKRGYFQQTFHVYGAADKPCGHCKTKLIDTRLGNRQTVYCPRCQG
jgi:formamidopyrimidine-DNA glycosylase